MWIHACVKLATVVVTANLPLASPLMVPIPQVYVQDMVHAMHLTRAHVIQTILVSPVIQPPVMVLLVQVPRFAQQRVLV